jgi:lipopolysaccharide/colanic/teichoic acid biosynthesis glycosyltransferase
MNLAFSRRIEDTDRLLQIIAEKKSAQEVVQEIDEQQNLFAEDTILLDSSDPESVLAHKTKSPSLIIHTRPLNEIKRLNTFLAYSNYCLDKGNYIFCRCTTADVQKEKILGHNPSLLNYLLYFLYYCWHRIFPSLLLTKGFYYWVTKGKSRAFSRVEVLGRLYRAGFEVVHEEIANGEFYVIASKQKDPVRNEKPADGLLIKLKRTGKNGKIGVYKFRTMYAYSEYLQPFIYKQQGLHTGGKIAHDYRVTTIGKFLRKVWLDELPMLLNWIKGDLKLVGVRPLSPHYFSLYSRELQVLRVQTKPGLIPPFYADMPVTLDEIQMSEKRYLNAYMESPLLTDWKYFWKALWNIVVKKERSK